MQLQYQTARLKSPGRNARNAAPSRVGWLGHLGVGQKLSLIAFIFGIPLAILVSFLVNARYAEVSATVKELRGLQQSAPLAGIQSGVYLFIDGVLNDDPKGFASGVTEANTGLKELSSTVGGRSVDRLSQVEESWKVLQQGTQDKFTLLNNFQIFMQSNQQQLVQEILSDSGLSAESDPAVASMISANQHNLPLVVTQLQLLALSGNLLKSNPSDPLLKKMTTRNMILAESALNSYEEDLKRAYAIQPALKDKLSKVNGAFLLSTREALNLTGHALNNSSFDAALFSAYSKSLNQARDAFKATITQVGTHLYDRAKSGYLALAIELGTIGLALLLTFFLLITLARSIVRPLSSLNQASRAMASGNLQIQVPVQGNDELGVMARTFNQAIGELRANQLKVEQDKLETQRLQENISEFLDVTMDIAEGDLTKRGKVTEDVLGNVVDSINLMTDELAGVLQNVQRASQSVTGGSQTMLETTQHIEQGTQLTTSEAQRLAKQAKDMNISIQQMAAIAQASAESARRAMHAAEQGQQAVQGTLQGMQAIRESTAQLAARIASLSERSEQIQQIVDAIGQIASQTNLLSLHASIEAAGAGEPGRRFAVVADEVRQLADLSSGMTTNISTLISRVQSEIQELAQSMQDNAAHVESGYQVAGQAGQRLSEISELAQVSAHFAQNISSTTKAQVQGVVSMNGAVQQIARIAEQSQSSVQEGRQAAEQLEQLAQQLRSTLARFKLST